MGDSAYCRTEALQMLEWADASPNRDMARRWRRLAEEYTTMAEQLEARDLGRPPLLGAPMQAQPRQQQQSKSRGRK